MTYLVIFLVLFSLLTLVALIFRFVQPELIYSVRHALVKVRTNKVFLDYDANRFTNSNVFPDLLMKDFRYESRDYDEQYVLKRVMKVRELYRILDMKRQPIPGLTKERKPQVCIIELASLLGSLGSNVTPDRKFNYATIDAASILTFIGNEIRRKSDENSSDTPLENASAVEAWFTKNPISVEQVIEILISAVFGLAYRQRVQDQSKQSEAAKENRKRDGKKKASADYPPSDPAASDRGGVQDAARPTATGQTSTPPEIATANRGALSGEANSNLLERPNAEPLLEAYSPVNPPQPNNTSVVRVFVSYSHHDEKYLKDDSLLGALRGMETDGVEFWYDQAITLGNKWDEEIKERIGRSHMALVLISQKFLDSPYCQGVEIKLFLQKAEEKGLVLCPIMLSRCEWELHDWLKSRQFLPTGNKTIDQDFTTVGKRQQLFHDIRQHLRQQIKMIRQKPDHSQPT